MDGGLVPESWLDLSVNSAVLGFENRGIAWKNYTAEQIIGVEGLRRT